MSGKATAAEIESGWTYRDMLTCLLFMDLEAVADWKATQKFTKENEIKL